MDAGSGCTERQSVMRNQAAMGRIRRITTGNAVHLDGRALSRALNQSHFTSSSMIPVVFSSLLPGPARRPWLAAFLPLLIAPVLCAQEAPEAVRAPATASPDPMAMSLRVPIHTHETDPVFGAYGCWAAGESFKCSFHDGFVYYPYLGLTYPENLPLRWTTTRVLSGELVLADRATLAGAESHHTEWCHEYRSRTVTERYDVLALGVEQTFVITERPAIAADLVVEGTFTTPMTLPPNRAAEHAPLSFRDAAGTAIVEVGSAWAIDATGNRLAIATSFVDGVARHVVPAAWLATAAFPITIDPLTTTALYPSVTPFGGGALTTSIHRQDESAVLNTMVAFVRAFSASDYDVYGFVGPASLAVSTLVFAETSTTSTFLPDVCYVAGADRWVVGYWSHDSANDYPRAYFHDRDNLTFNSGVVATNHNPPGEHITFPAVGGTSHPTIGTTGLMVYRSDPFFGNSTNSQSYAVGLDAAARAFVNPRTIISTNTLGDVEGADVNCQIGWGDNFWIVAYQSRSSVFDDFDIYVTRVSTSLTVSAASADQPLQPANLGDKVRPVVQGWDGRYMVAMLQNPTPETNGLFFGSAVYVDRFDWPNASLTPTVYSPAIAATSGQQDITRLGLAFDGVDYSHWCLTYGAESFSTQRCKVARLGYSGGATESDYLGGGMAGTLDASATWNGVTREFQLVYCGNALGGPVYAQRFSYPATAFNQLTGLACGPGTISSDTQPYAGTEYYRVSLSSGGTNQLAILTASFTPGSFSLIPVGAPGCFLNVGSLDVTLGFVTNAVGATTYTLALPDQPVFAGNLYWQYAYVWPASPNPLALGFTQGMRSSVQ